MGTADPHAVGSAARLHRRTGGQMSAEDQTTELTSVEGARAKPPDGWEEWGLARRVAWAQSQIGRVQRDGHAVIEKDGRTLYSYDYITEGVLMDAVRGYLSDVGVAVFVEFADVRREGSLTTVLGSAVYACDGPGGYHEMRVGIAGTGADQGDKGLYKAMTGAMRYHLWKSNLIPTG